jgi:hypothetical protein
MRLEKSCFGSICVDGTTYKHDLVIDRREKSTSVRRGHRNNGVRAGSTPPAWSGQGRGPAHVPLDAGREMKQTRPRCRVIMWQGKLLAGVAMPKLGPPPPDPNTDREIQKMRDTWDMRIIAWEGVWPRRRRGVA